MIGQFGVADRDVTGDTLGEAEATEQPQRAGQLLLALEAFLFDCGEFRSGQQAEGGSCLAWVGNGSFHGSKISSAHDLPHRRHA